MLIEARDEIIRVALHLQVSEDGDDGVEAARDEHKAPQEEQREEAVGFPGHGEPDADGSAQQQCPED